MQYFKQQKLLNIGDDNWEVDIEALESRFEKKNKIPKRSLNA